MESPTNLPDTLAATIAKVEASPLPGNITLVRMLRHVAEIDGSITNPSGDDADDRPPTGDDYNLLYDVIMDYVDARFQLQKDDPAPVNARMLAALKALRDWAAFMGGWDAPCWTMAAEAIKRAEGRGDL